MDLQFFGTADEHSWNGKQSRLAWSGARGGDGGQRFRIPDLAIGDDRHLPLNVHRHGWCAYYGFPGDLNETGQKRVRLPDQVYVAALGPVGNCRIGLHVGEYQDGDEEAD